ncbi:DUF6455 family protein [Shimia marina]|uniref:DUF6455 domain-containing protein n=1 Tax=Shimia marina TaxID=321267 RepID=A0A0P1ERL6_9RHOB|nr:DUF6455 family protein [Shimia marina]CUH53154.1 hypothetical protein SHM7688_02606 [Shimia marina]SFD83438.1 hypothetical protein SAMN04488037_102667 [Shimia marina]
MKPLGDRNKHFWLAQRMAKLTQTDLVAAMERSELSQADWAAMVEQCRSCAWGEGCQKWLGRHALEGPEHEDIAPSACVNRTRFDRLKKALEAHG